MKNTFINAAALLMIVSAVVHQPRAQTGTSPGKESQQPSAHGGREAVKPDDRTSGQGTRPAVTKKMTSRSGPTAKGYTSRPVNSLPPDVLKGVQTVRVSAEESSTIKVGLARLGQVAIEFPSADRVYKVSPAPEEFVKTNKVVFTRNDPVILYPGTGFVVPKGRTTAVPATILSVQMFSGLIVAVHVYPVESLAENATRVYVNYDRAVVVNARRAAGLPVNFDQIIEAEDSERRTKSRKPVLVAESENVTENSSEEVARNESPKAEAGGESAVVTANATAPKPQPALPSARPNYLLVASMRPPLGALQPRSSSDDTEKPSKAADVEREFFSRVAQSELTATIKLGPKALSKFTAPKYGLSIAAGRLREVDARHRSVVIAVRNTLREPVRLVPEQPDLAVVTLNSERPTDNDAVALSHRETTVKDNKLAAGEIGYFSIIFETPTLGVHQILSANVAQIFAADAPANLDLVITAR